MDLLKHVELPGLKAAADRCNGHLKELLYGSTIKAKIDVELITAHEECEGMCVIEQKHVRVFIPNNFNGYTMGMFPYQINVEPALAAARQYIGAAAYDFMRENEILERTKVTVTREFYKNSLGGKLLKGQVFSWYPGEGWKLDALSHDAADIEAARARPLIAKRDPWADAIKFGQVAVTVGNKPLEVNYPARALRIVNKFINNSSGIDWKVIITKREGFLAIPISNPNPGLEVIFTSQGDDVSIFWEGEEITRIAPYDFKPELITYKDNRPFSLMYGELDIANP